ncbi:hypothetical protein ABZP36_018880 [Zizania latifolia]
MRFLMVSFCRGLDNSGKTTIVLKINGEDTIVIKISPTLGFNIKTIRSPCLQVQLHSSGLGASPSTFQHLRYSATLFS